jgi:hypothetical protein
MQLAELKKQQMELMELQKKLGEEEAGPPTLK